MLHVKAIKNIAEGGVELIPGKRDAAGQPMRLKFGKDQIFTIHEEGAKKYLERGLIQVVQSPSQEQIAAAVARKAAKSELKTVDAKVETVKVKKEK